MVTRLEAYRALNYGCALTIFLFVAFSVLVGLGRVKRREQVFKPTSRHYVLLIGVLALSYATEGVIAVIKDDDFLQSQPSTFRTATMALIWAVVGARKNAGRYELLGTALITIVFEVPLLALSSFHGLGHFTPTSQQVSQVIRISVLLYLLADILRARPRTKEVMGEESQPFLCSSDRDQSSREASYGTEPLLDHSDIEDDSLATDSDDDFDSDSDERDIKKRRAKRLQEVGSWWVYLKDFSILLPYLVPRKDRKVQSCIAVSLLCLAGNRVLNILVPVQLGIVTNKLLDKESPYGALCVWLALHLVSDESGLGLIEELAKIPIKQFSYRQITNAAFNHVMSLGMDFHAERDSAEVMKAVDQSEALTNLLDTVVIDIAPTIVDLLIAYVFLYWKFNIYATLAMVVASITYISVEVFLSNWNTANRRRLTKAEREEARVMHEAVQGWQTVSFFNMFAYERRRFGESVEGHLTASRDWSQRNAVIRAILQLMVPMTFFGIASLVLYEIARGQASPGDFVFFIQYWETLIHPLTFLSEHYRWLMSDLIDAERLLSLLQTKPSIPDDGTVDLRPGKGNVAFKHVHFSYSTRKATLEDINISAAAGETIALVGASGGGKSTMIKLLLRLYDVSSGRIEIDGHDIRDVTLSSLRDMLGVVPQDPLLFNTSILENVRYARPSATDEELFAACRAAAIHDKILTFPARYGTTVGEQGVKLSRGEMQRLAIARAILKDAPILILDEATSAVDTNTESEIQDALERLCSRRTTFLIAHRLSTVVGADRILVVHDGRIVESGTHHELLAKGGRYSNLWTKQTAAGLEGKRPTIEELAESDGGDDDDDDDEEEEEEEL